MKIIKYPHSCIMIETNGKKILIDPGDINYKPEFQKEWGEADCILITHRHKDHCNADILKNLHKVKIYSTSEVAEKFNELEVNIIKQGDILDLGGVKAEVVKAVHGYLPKMKGNTIRENVGYIVDDGNRRLYHTGDSMCFENDYKANILCIAVSGHVSMTEFEAGLVAKDMEAELVIPIHMESPLHPVDIEKVKKSFDELGIKYKIMQNGESIEA